ncbi:MAG: zinc transport system substrate-binding protein [Parcubacteria group bacterium Athens0714_26]|nr:MAG: zinc transport system substrate-binding protein [Parcubacteria group bacterium Athens0714_26]
MNNLQNKNISNRVKKILFAVGVIAIIAIGFFAVLNIAQKPTNNSQKITVVTTLFPLYDFAKSIGGDKVEVSLLLPPGVEAHTFEPKPSDIVNINESDLFVYTGKFMEPWAEDIIRGISGKDIKIVDTSAGIELMKEEEHEDKHGTVHEEEEHGHEHGGIDPHIWLDFDNNKIMLDNIVKALTEKDPANADYYQKNATDYKTKLAQLDNQYRTTLSKCESKEIVYGGHYAFGYLGKRYGLAYESAYGISPDSEPSAQDLAKIVEQIKKEKIKYVFFEELVSPKVAETLAKETGAGLLLLNPAHNLTKKDFENKASFLSIMEKNLVNLKIGLQCNE